LDMSQTLPVVLLTTSLKRGNRLKCEKHFESYYMKPSLESLLSSESFLKPNMKS